jgi:hypothetical protein
LRGTEPRCKSFPNGIGKIGNASPAMSGEPLSARDQPSPQQVGAVAQLIADALAQVGDSQAKLASIVTEAAYDLDGKMTTVHSSAVSRWVNGVIIPRANMRRWIAHGLAKHGLAISRQQLDAAAAEDRKSRKNRVSNGTIPPNSPIPSPQAAVDSDDVERKAFLGWMASGAVALATLDFERVGAMLAGARADSAALDDMETLTRDLVKREATLAPSALLPAVQGHLQGLRDVLLWTPSSLTRRAHSLAGQAALLAGYLKFKQDRHADADAYYAMAHQFGDLAGDPRLLAALLVLQAQRWEGENQPREGENHALVVSLLDRAVSLLGSDPGPATAAHVLTFRARSYAEASSAEAAYVARAMRDLDDLQRHLARLPSADASLYIVESVRGEAIQKGAMALVHLGRPVEAAAQLSALLAANGQMSLSWRAHVMTNLAVAHVANGDSEHASDLLSVSLQLAAQAAAPRGVNRVSHARRRWLAGHESPAVSRLDEQLAAFAPPPGTGPTHFLPAS